MQGQPVERLFGKSKRPGRGETCLDLYSTSQTEGMESAPELFGRHKDGTEINVELSSSPLKTGDELLIIHMIRNNTERMARDRQRAVRQAARRIMTESATLRDAASSLLQVLCEGLRWDLAFLWIVDHKTGGLERVA